MEGNKDEALRCKQLAKKAIQDGRFNEAARLLDKSYRMFPCESTRNLIETLNLQQNEERGSNLPHSSTVSTDGDDWSKITGKNTHTRNTSCNEKAHSANSASVNNTPKTKTNNKFDNNQNSTTRNIDTSNVSSSEQFRLTQKILKTSNYYEIIGVEQNATDETIKKTYKKLALLLHPDKNKAPNADEAFKKLLKAFQCLSNPEKRQSYDHYGTESQPPIVGRDNDTDVMAAQEIFAYELFQAFFGNGMNDETRRRFRYQRRSQPSDSQQQQRLYSLIQLLPIVLLLSVTILSNFFQRTPKSTYSFDFSPDYPIRRRTKWNSVSYYVSKDFENNFPRNSNKHQDLEISVELTYFQRECAKEEQELMRQLQMARYYGSSSNRIKMAEQGRGPNCQMLHKLRRQTDIQFY